jgi:hypothetical protein
MQREMQRLRNEEGIPSAISVFIPPAAISRKGVMLFSCSVFRQIIEVVHKVAVHLRLVCGRTVLEEFLLNDAATS